jgi:HD-GYP domain-containing protein (c-di-GMP phosphodiesterase class II)
MSRVVSHHNVDTGSPAAKIRPAAGELAKLEEAKFVSESAPVLDRSMSVVDSIAETRVDTIERWYRDLHAISLALSAEHDISRLLKLILTKSRELSSADGGSLYLLREDRENGGSRLYFSDAQNDTISVDTSMEFAVSPSSLAGYTAFTGQTLCFEDVYTLPRDAPYKFNPAFDREHGYRTKSVLVVPLMNHANQVIGVLQLINRKRHRDVLLHNDAIVEREVISFDQDLQGIVAALASQAAVALENNILLREIENLFDSFVKAAASAIEDRDPCTSGHTIRVSILTEALALAVNAATEGPFKDIQFSAQRLRELRYATTMHDFGKIGVRENILTKSHKLEPLHFENVKHRLVILQRDLEQECSQCKIAALLELPREAALCALKDLDNQYGVKIQEIQHSLALLERINDPAVVFVPDEEYEQQKDLLSRLARMTYRDENGTVRPMLTREEIIALSIRKGSLTKKEYEQIQKHAQMSYDFLQKIDWTDDFKDIPNIAYCHHEKLNGKGYPRGITGEQIPLQARLMTVADIFDAITASDRPYKKAVPIEIALKVLQREAEEGGLDKDVVDLFISQQIYKKTEGWHSPMSDGATCTPIEQPRIVDPEFELSSDF